MQPLDYLVIAPHPDDAELGAGGTILLLQAQGGRVGVLDLTDGEPTPLRQPRNPPPRDRRRHRRPRPGLARQPRAGQPPPRSRPRRPRPAGRRPPRTAAAHPLRPLLGGRPPRPRRRHRPRRCRPLLGQAHQDPTSPASPIIPQRILYYFSVHLRIHPRPSFVLDVTPHFETKMQAVACYRSQFIEGRDPTPPTAAGRPPRPRPLLGLGHRRRLRRAVRLPRGSGVAQPARSGVTAPSGATAGLCGPCAVGSIAVRPRPARSDSRFTETRLSSIPAGAGEKGGGTCGGSSTSWP